MTTTFMPAMDPYEAFLRAKMSLAPSFGMEISDKDIHPALFRHQRPAVQWAVHGGRRALFEKFGLGKTIQQLEIERVILNLLGYGRGLIVCPLGVRMEFMKDAHLLGVKPRFIRRTEEIEEDGIYLTNTPSVREGLLDPSVFQVVSMDEADCLRDYGSKTFQESLTQYQDVPFRYVATATPSPNKLKELIHYAAFLGLMDSGQALTRWFQRDSKKANNLTLYPHKEKEFWLWVASWALFLQSPSDLGFSNEGYDLPELDMRFHELPATHIFGEPERDGQTTMMAAAGMGLVRAAKEKRDSAESRIAKVREIMDEDPDDHFLLWHTTEKERAIIEKTIPGIATVFGQKKLEEREEIVADFAAGRIKDLATKPILNGSGSNLQGFCHRAIFAGIDYKNKDLLQAIHRLHRFGQKHPVRKENRKRRESRPQMASLFESAVQS